jgi:hypothetical protein
VQTQQNSFADFADLARRGQDTASDVLGLWTSTIQTGSEQSRFDTVRELTNSTLTALHSSTERLAHTGR